MKRYDAYLPVIISALSILILGYVSEKKKLKVDYLTLSLLSLLIGLTMAYITNPIKLKHHYPKDK